MSTGLYDGVRRSGPRRVERRQRLQAACESATPRPGRMMEALESRVFLTAVVQASADTFIRNHAYGATNFGASPALYVQNAGSGDSRVALVKFDLSGVSAINSAVLRATATLERPESSAVHMNVYGVANTAWVEGDGTAPTFNGNGADTDNSPAGEITWNNAPAGLTTLPGSGSPIAAAVIDRYGYETYSWDVGAYLQQQKNAGNNVVSLAFDTAEQGASWTRILARENSPNGPELVINDGGASVPVAIVRAPDVTDPATGSVPVSVTYSGDQPIDPSSINPGNISVSGPGGGLSVADASISQSGSGNRLTAIYDVAAPAGGWSAANNGLFTVTVNDHQVRDSGGGFVQPSEGQFRVAVNDSTAPVANISAPNLTAAAQTYQFTVTYSDNVAIDVSTIDVDNVHVRNSSLINLPIVNAQVDNNSNGAPRSVTYTVAGLNGAFSSADNGTYTVVYDAGQVRDTAGNAAASASTTFQVAIGSPQQDTTPPTARISGPAITQPGGGGEQVTVVYTDDTAVKASSITTANLSVTGPAGPLQVTAVNLTPSQDNAQITAVYTIAAPTGGWQTADNGTYTVTLNGGQITDTLGNATPATSGSFNVNIANPDSTPPTAHILAPDIKAPGGASESISVTYTDDTAVDLSTIGAGNITVVGPQGALSVTGVQVSATASGSPVTAIYTIAAPHGTWSVADNGAYTVTVVPFSVKDTSGNGVVAATGTFNVDATNPDTTPPSAQITAPAITNPGAVSQTITIVYTDDVAVNAASINAGNISVTGPGGPLNVTAVAVSGGNGSPLIATYAVAAPNGMWTSADNGSYIVALKANQVSDTSGNFANGVSGSFTINIPAQAGNGPDPSFNSGQSVGTNFVTEAILTQPDGKVLAVGRVGDLSAGTSQGVIERFNADGSLDQSFGSHGMVISQSGVNEAYFAGVMQDASHFIVAGTSGGDFVLARYDTSGRLDASFGSSGRVIADFGTNADIARGIAIAPGGMIVVGGDSGGNFAFARLDPNGHFDPNFAQNGRQLFGLGDGSNNAMGTLVAQSDGKILAVGAEGGGVVAVRLSAAGEADGAFGRGGLVNVPGIVARTDLGTPDRSQGLSLLSNGQILIANRTSSGHFGMVRLNPSGTVDTTFGTNGLVAANFGGDDDADSIVAQSTGAVVLVGTSLQNGTPQTAVAAFDTNGNPLTGFANNGLLLLPNDIKASTLASGSARAAITPSSLHVGDIVLRAFGTVTSDGRVVIGTSNEAVAATTSSTLRRLIVPGAQVGSTAGLGDLKGSFGVVNGKVTRLTVTAPDGTKVTFALTGGTGQVYLNGDRFNLIINDLGKGVVLTITARGGTRRASLGDVNVSGTLRAMNARNSDIFGTLHVTGAIGTLNVGNISGNVWSGGSIAGINAGNLTGNLFATGALGRLRFHNVSGTIASGSGAISSITAASMDSARVLSGANLGADGLVGGAAGTADADTYGAGAIGSIRVSGAITKSFIGAGVDPVDSTFGNSNDKVIGGTTSKISSIKAKSADQATLFEAGSFGKASLPKTVNVLQDPRFKVL